MINFVSGSVLTPFWWKQWLVIISSAVSTMQGFLFIPILKLNPQQPVQLFSPCRLFFREFFTGPFESFDEAETKRDY